VTKRKRTDRAEGLSPREFDETTGPIINDLQRAAIGTPLVNPALRQLASGGISTARGGREAAFDVLATTVRSIERLLAASRTSAGRALGVRPPRPRPSPTPAAGEVASAVAAANAAAAAAASAAMAAQAAATMMASIASGAGARVVPAGSPGEAGDVSGAASILTGAATADAAGAMERRLAAMPLFSRITGPSITSAFVRSRADLGTGRMRAQQQVRPGAPLRVVLTVTNAAKRVQKGVTLRSSDGISSRGDRIAGGAVTFAPQAFDLAPRGRVVVTATIDVPPDARSGSYTARIFDPNHDGVETILTFEVR